MTNADSLEIAMLNMLNDLRRKNGKAELTLEKNLNEAAEDYAETLLARNHWSHTGPDGSSARDRATAAGFDFVAPSTVGENLGIAGADGDADQLDEVQKVFDALVNSPSHYENMLKDKYTHVGIGIETGTHTILGGAQSMLGVQLFGGTAGSVDEQILGGGGTSRTETADADDDASPTAGSGTTNSGATEKGNADDRIVTGDKADVIRAGGGDDVVDSGRGNDRVEGGAGDDLIRSGAGHDKVRGGDGDDRIVTSDGNDQVWGDDGNDVINAGDGDDVVNAGRGRDRVELRDGDDVFRDVFERGPDGADWVDGGRGNDVMHGGGGNDVFRGSDGNDRLNGGHGDDKLIGGRDDDTLNGGAGDDRLHGQAGNDKIVGGAGFDRLLGYNGDDVLWGYNGRDLMNGGGGDDILAGGSGNDAMTGSKGNDTFIFRKGYDRDVVNDMTDGEDILKLDDNLWGNANLGIWQVVGRYGEITDDGLLLDFGEDELLLRGLDRFHQISDQVEFV
ncbi:CAP domain-containing protein [Jannaschia sp. W003]|uniref:CAP domain-containing protein n=1 Tax=Jannaschia sp. W003 TaxID=2867012 RepID=UPI0021A5DA52|nr:CAP domain-containing protein [Jannaschia sp. W003]UWQ20595.1 CAP domain-containing protein [Jannaschia sp. W003]